MEENTMAKNTIRSEKFDIHKINFLTNLGFILIVTCLGFITSLSAIPNEASAADVSGTVRDAGGSPIMGVEIEVQVLTGNPCGGWYHLQSVQTDSLNGTYAFTGLAAGQYYLKTNNMNASDYVNEWWASPSSVVDCGGAQYMELSTGGVISGIDFQLNTGVEVSGTVFQSDGVTPIDDAAINIDLYQSDDPCSGQQWMGNASIEANGTYTIRGVVPGDYFVKTDSMNQSNYIDEWWTNGVSASECGSAEILTVGAGGVTNVNFQLDEGVEVYGTVYQINGSTPITVVEIQVQIFRGSPCGGGYHIRTANTDSSDGTYTLMGIPPGAYYLKTHHMQQSNYIDKFWSSGGSVYDCDDAETLTVGAGGEIDIDFQLEQGVEISGTIFHSDGTTPITGVLFDIQAIQGDPCGWHQGRGGVWINPEDGTYTIRGLPGGEYYVRTNNINQSNYINEWWSSTFDAIDCSDAQSFNVTSGGQSGVDFRLELGVEISGTVYQSNGTTPVTGDQIDIQAIQGDPCGGHQWRGGVWINPEDGTYTIRGLPGGEYYVRTNNMNQSNYINEWWSSTFDAIECGDAQSFNVTSGGQSGVDFRLELGVEISGTVYQSNGTTPVTGDQIDVQAIQGEPCGWNQWRGGQWTNPEDGTYVIRGLPAGEYYVRTNNMNQSNYIDEWWSSGGSSFNCGDAQFLSLTAGGQSGVDFQLDLGAEISGTIYQIGGSTPVTEERIQVNVVQGDPCGEWYHVRGVETDPADGTFTVRGVPLGTYYLRTHNMNQSNYVDAWWTGEGRTYDCAEAGSIALGSGGQSGVDFQLDLGVEISGTVYESDGSTPITIIQVGVAAIQGDPCGGYNWVSDTTTDLADGTYRLMGLLPGEYFLRTDNRNWSNYLNEWWASSGNSSLDCADAGSLIISGSGLSEKNFQLDEGGSISGTVNGSDGPLSNVWVEAFTGRCWDNYAGGANTDQEGYYRIRGLPPGNIFVHAWPGEEVNYFEQWYNGSAGTQDCNSAMPVTITPAETETVDFTLEAGFTIEGSVMNVHEPTGTDNFRTYIEVAIGGDFVGNLPGDISSIAVEAPGGSTIAAYPGNLVFDPQWNSFFVALTGSPALGVYTFTVTSTDAIVTKTDYQYVLRTFPLPDTSNFSPAAGAIINSKTPSFTWTPIEYESPLDVAIHYRLEIYNDVGGGPGQRVFATGRVLDMYYYTMPVGRLSPGQYWWRVRVMDSGEWIKVQNRVNSAWIPFTVAGPLTPHSAMPAIDLDRWGAITWSWGSNTAYF